jgi:hypothetical protein
MAGCIVQSNNGGVPFPASNGAVIESGGMPIIKLTSDSSADLSFTVLSDAVAGTVKDLTGVTTVRLRSREMECATALHLDKVATIEDAVNGVIGLEFTKTDLQFAGVWWAAIQLYNSDGCLTEEFPIWLYIQHGLNNVNSDNSPINIFELRYELLDINPDTNFLLNDLEFRDDELLYCIRRVVDEWNETPPPIETYTAATFPFRNAWLKAAAGRALHLAARRYARNQLAYNAGGVSVDDQNKMQPYLTMATQLTEDWQNFIVNKKFSMNAEKAYGGVGSPAFVGYYYGNGY